MVSCIISSGFNLCYFMWFCQSYFSVTIIYFASDNLPIFLPRLYAHSAGRLSKAVMHFGDPFAKRFLKHLKISIKLASAIFLLVFCSRLN